MNKTPTLGKTPNLRKISSPEKVPSPEEILTPDKDPIPEETQTLEDKAPGPDSVVLVDQVPAPGEPSEDEVPGPKMAPSGDKASTIEKALTQKQVLSEEASTGENTQLHPFFLEAALPKGKSLPVNKAQPRKQVHLPEEPHLSKMRHPLDKRDSSVLQSEAKPGFMPALERAHPPNEASTLLEEAPAKDESTPKEEVPLKEVAPAQKDPHPIKPAPDPQETPTLHSLVPQNPTDSKSDRDDIMRLQDQVESLRRALELMGAQLE